MDLAPYQYEQLPDAHHLRILSLHPSSNFDDDLRCSIRVVSRITLSMSTNDKNNHYEAVSYCWGKAEFEKVLICQGETFLKISKNVDVMLRWLREPERARNLWIDAITLNQADAAEKSQQIPLMGRIYHDAANVVVWLGHELEPVVQTFALLQTLARYPKSQGDLARDLATHFGIEWRSLLLNLLDSPWFSRRWVLQEVARSRNTTVQSQHMKIGWTFMKDAVKLFEENKNHRRLLDPFPTQALNTISQASTSDAPFLDRLWHLDSAQCTEPGDRLFALYGFASGSVAEWLPNVDYSCSLGMLWGSFVAKCIYARATNKILNHIDAFGSLHDSDSAAASWIPNWKMARARHVLFNQDIDPSDKRLPRSKQWLFPAEDAQSSRLFLVLRGSVAPVSHKLNPPETVQDIYSWLQAIVTKGPLFEPSRYLFQSKTVTLVRLLSRCTWVLIDEKMVPPEEARMLNRFYNKFRELGNFYMQNKARQEWFEAFRAEHEDLFLNVTNTILKYCSIFASDGLRLHEGWYMDSPRSGESKCKRDYHSLDLVLGACVRPIMVGDYVSFRPRGGVRRKRDGITLRLMKSNISGQSLTLLPAYSGDEDVVNRLASNVRRNHFQLLGTFIYEEDLYRSDFSRRSNHFDIGREHLIL